ncbi:MAG: hypothetical protein ACM3X0_09180 [Bacteroidota bacterium]
MPATSLITIFRKAARLRRAGLALAALLLALPACAEDEPALSFRGFGTLGAVRTTTNQAEFVRDLSQPRGATERWDGRVDSILGLQANWRVVPELEAVVQGVTRYRYDDSYRPEISWAYLKYDPTPQLSLRAGRLGTEFFMMADSRQVGYSYLPVRPPGDFFWYLPFYSIHGADAALNLPFGEGVLRGKVFYGHSDGQIPLAEEQWDIQGSPMTGGYLEYHHAAWQLRASYANIRFKNDLPVAPVLKAETGYDLSSSDAAFLATRRTRTHYYSLGAIYDRDNWQAQVMLNHIEQGSNALQSSDGGYALVGYRIGEVTPYVGYSWVRSRARDNAPSLLAAIVMADSRSDQTTTILGARWDVARNIALKAQWDGIRGEPQSIFPYRRETSAWTGKMDVYSLTMDFIF